MSVRRIAASVVAVFIAAAPTLGADYFLDTWDDGDLSLWVQDSSSTTVEVVDAGGNPGGYLESTGSGFAGMQTFKLDARGDYNVAEVVGVHVDIRVVDGAPLQVIFRVRQGAGVNGWFYNLPLGEIGANWSSHAAPIDPTWTNAEAMGAGWAPEGAVPTWQDTLASVDSIAVRTFGAGDLTMAYDNFELMALAPPCPGDTSDDGLVNADDLAILLAQWGACPVAECVADLDENGVIDPTDLALLLADWGPCP